MMKNNQYYIACLCSYLFASIYPYVYLATLLIKLSNGDIESDIVCRLDEKTDNTSFWTGQFLSGNVEYVNFKDENLKLNSIDIELIGELVYSTRGEHGSINTEYLTFFQEKVNLYSEEDKRSFQLEYGNYRWPFRFYLNKTLPPSFDKVARYHPSIRYFLRITFVKSEWYKRNLKKTIPTIIRHAQSLIKSTKLMVQKQNRHNVRLQVTLNNATVLVGEDISFNIDIHNPKRKLIHRVTVTFIQYTNLGPADETTTTIFNKRLDNIDSFRDIHFDANFLHKIPETLPPTFLWSGGPITSKSPFVVRYELNFKAHISGFFTDIHLNIPLVVIDDPQKKFKKSI